MASQTTEQMKRALLGGYDEQGEEQTGLFGYLSAPGQYLRGGLSDVLSWLPGGVPAHGFTGRKMWGEDVLREHLGMENKPGLDMTDVLGTGMDLLVDPLNLLYGAGAIKGGLKAARMLPKLLSSAGRAESLAAAKAALGGLPGAAKAHAPGLAFGLGVPMAGASLMGSNEEGSDWKDLIGMGMMTLPLALPLGMAAARKMKGGGAAAVKEVLQAPKQGPFYSRLEEALLNAPEKFETRPEAVRVVPAKTITHPQTGAVIKEIPEQRHVTPGQTAYEQMRAYLEGRAHPQEIDWVLGERFADQPNISKQAMIDAYNEAKISLETERHGGAKAGVYQAGVKSAWSPISGEEFPTRMEAVARAKTMAQEANERHGAIARPEYSYRPIVRKRSDLQHGPLEFPDMLIPGGKNTTEVPIKLNTNRPPANELETLRTMKLMGVKLRPEQETFLANAETGKADFGPLFPDTAGHFGDDVVAWTIHDQRKMPDGKTATFIQELQSDWHQKGAKTGYGVPPTRKEISDAIFDSVEDQRVMIDKYGSVGIGMDMLENIPRIADELDFSQRVKDLFHKTKLVPDAPFKGNEWTKLAIKQAMADAASRGDDYVLLPPPELVSRTQGMPIEKARKFYGEIVPNLVNEMLKPHGTKLEKMPLPGVNSSAMKNKLYDRANNLRHEAQSQFGDGWMNRASETGTPESEMWQQIRELEVRAERGQPDALGFRIPDSLKKQIKTRGFPLMQVGLPLAGAAGLGAYAASQEGT